LGPLLAAKVNRLHRLAVMDVILKGLPLPTQLHDTRSCPLFKLTASKNIGA